MCYQTLEGSKVIVPVGGPGLVSGRGIKQIYIFHKLRWLAARKGTEVKEGCHCIAMNELGPWNRGVVGRPQGRMEPRKDEMEGKEDTSCRICMPVGDGRGESSMARTPIPKGATTATTRRSSPISEMSVAS